MKLPLMTEINQSSDVNSTRTLNFTIVDSNGDAIKSANVVIDDVSKTTGSAGGCSFKDMLDGEYSVTVSADGFETLTETILVDADNTVFLLSLTEI